MAHAVRAAWNANRHWAAPGFLASTILFLLLIFVSWRNERLGIEQRAATGLSATTWDLRSARSQKNLLQLPRFQRRAPMSVDYARSAVGGMVGGVSTAGVEPR